MLLSHEDQCQSTSLSRSTFRLVFSLWLIGFLLFILLMAQTYFLPSFTLTSIYASWLPLMVIPLVFTDCPILLDSVHLNIITRSEFSIYGWKNVIARISPQILGHFLSFRSPPVMQLHVYLNALVEHLYISPNIRNEYHSCKGAGYN